MRRGTKRTYGSRSVSKSRNNKAKQAKRSNAKPVLRRSKTIKRKATKGASRPRTRGSKGPIAYIRKNKLVQTRVSNLNGEQFTAATNGEQQWAVVGELGATATIQARLISAGLTGSDAANQNVNYIVGNVGTTCHMTNGKNLPCMIRAYHMSPKKDIPFSYVTDASIGYTTTATTVALLKAMAVPDISGAVDWASPGIGPNELGTIRSHFKVNKTITRTLAPGDTMKLTNSLKASFVKGDNFVKDGVYAYKALHSFWLIAFIGVPVHDQTTDTLVSYGKAELNVCTNEDGAYYRIAIATGGVNHIIVSTLGSIAAENQMVDSSMIDATINT